MAVGRGVLGAGGDGRGGSATLRAAHFPADGVTVRPAPLPPGVLTRIPAPSVSHLVDVEVWLHALASDLTTAVGSGSKVEGGFW